MRFVLVIKEGIKQVVLTPETDGEVKLLEVFRPLNKERPAKMFSGNYEIARSYNSSKVPNSLIILVKDDDESPEAEAGPGIKELQKAKIKELRNVLIEIHKAHRMQPMGWVKQVEEIISGVLGD